MRAVTGPSAQPDLLPTVQGSPAGSVATLQVYDLVGRNGEQGPPGGTGLSNYGDARSKPACRALVSLW